MQRYSSNSNTICIITKWCSHVISLVRYWGLCFANMIDLNIWGDVFSGSHRSQGSLKSWSKWSNSSFPWWLHVSRGPHVLVSIAGTWCPAKLNVNMKGKSIFQKACFISQGCPWAHVAWHEAKMSHSLWEILQFLINLSASQMGCRIVTWKVCRNKICMKETTIIREPISSFLSICLLTMMFFWNTISTF